MLQKLLEPANQPLLHGWVRASSGDNELCAVCLHSVAVAITPRGGVDYRVAAAWTSGRQQLFAQLANAATVDGALQSVMDKIRLPFPQVRYACYDVLRSLAEQPGGWGLEAMKRHIGCMQLLLNRTIEDDKQGT